MRQLDSSIEQAQCGWLDQFRMLASQRLGAQPNIPAYVLGYDDDGTMSVLARLLLPSEAPQMLLAMSRCSQYLDDCPIVVRGKELSGLMPTFSLSSVLSNGYPKDARTAKFKNNAAGCMAGRSTIAPQASEHVVYAGMIVWLMDECLRYFSPLGTADDMIHLARDMYLTFEDCG